jgi:hypothetical protein
MVKNFQDKSTDRNGYLAKFTSKLTEYAWFKITY